MITREEVLEALNSEKCSKMMGFSPYREFERILREDPDIDLSRTYLPLLVETSTHDMVLPGELGALGNIHSVLAPYERIPEIVKDPRVLRIDASTSRYTTDE